MPARVARTDYVAEILFVGSLWVVVAVIRCEAVEYLFGLVAFGAIVGGERCNPDTLRAQRGPAHRRSEYCHRSSLGPLPGSEQPTLARPIILMDTPNNRRLAEVLGNLAVEMQSQHSSESVLRAIVVGAIDVVPGTSCAGISRVAGRTVTSEMPSDAIAAELDQLQTELNEGPALSALHERHTVFIKNMSEETRWPNFVAAATLLGVHCMLSFRLFVINGSLGALNLFGAAPEALTEDSVAIGEIFAQHAAVAMAGAAAEEQMQSAVATRDIIGQAKGILMHRDNLTGLQAFATLTRASQETNLRLVNVARWLVNEHESKLQDQ